MTKVRFEGPIGGFSGSMGKMVFADQKKNGKTIAYMKSQQVPTEAKLERKACFLEASAWADVARAVPRSVFHPSRRLSNDSTNYRYGRLMKGLPAM